MHIGGLCLWLRQIKIMNYVAKKNLHQRRFREWGREGEQNLAKTSCSSSERDWEWGREGEHNWPKPHVSAVRDWEWGREAI